jgi:putative peptidoglycan lipid II flippase
MLATRDSPIAVGRPGIVATDDLGDAASVTDTGNGAGRRPARGLGRSTALFSFWTAVSRVAGLLREILAAALFGTAGAINAFVIAFQVPNLLRSLVADSAISAAMVPIYTQLQEEGRPRDARRLVGALAGVITLGLGLITLLAIVIAPWMMPLFAPGLDPGLQDDVVWLAQLMFPIVPLLGLTGIVSGVLQAEGRFTPTAFVPVLWNAVIIIALGVVAPFAPEDNRIWIYALGILAGTLAQLLYLLPHLRGLGPFPLSVGLGNRLVRRVLVLMLPVTVGLGLININAVVDGIFATLVSEQAVRAIDAAFRLYILPQGVFSVAIATVLFPTISRMAANRDLPGLRDSVSSGLRQIFFLLLPASAFLMVLAEPVVRLVYQRGAFDGYSTLLTSEALFFFTIGLVFNGASLLLIRAFFSLQQPWLPTAVAGIGVVLNAVLDALLYQPMGVGGIPLSTSITSLATFLVLLYYLSDRTGGLDLRFVAEGFVQALLAAVAAGFLAWLTWRVLDDALGRSLIAQMVSVGAAAAATVLAIVAAARAMNMPEMTAIVRVLSRRRGLR